MSSSKRSNLNHLGLNADLNPVKSKEDDGVNSFIASMGTKEPAPKTIEAVAPKRVMQDTTIGLTTSEKFAQLGKSEEDGNMTIAAQGRARAQPNLAYGARRPGGNISGQEEQYHQITEENLQLKEKQNVLESEIKKMHTKMRRIEALMKKERNLTDNDFADLEQELQLQLGEIQGENSELRDRVRKLNMIHKGLQNSKSNTQTGKMPGKGKTLAKSRTGEPYHGATKAQGDRIYNDLKKKMVENERTVAALSSELSRLTGGEQIPQLQELFRQLQEKDMEISDIQRALAEEKHKFKSKEDAHAESKNDAEALQGEIERLRKEVANATQTHFKLKSQSLHCKDVQSQLDSVKKEKEDLESSMRKLTEEPFFKREQGESAQQKILGLEAKKDHTAKILYSLVDEEARERGRLQKAEEEFQKLKGKRDHLKEENEKLKRGISENANFHEMDVYKSLFKMDPKLYGKTIQDLSDPSELGRVAYLERGEQGHDPNDVAALKREINRLRHEGKDFASELERVQHLLQLQKDIEHDNIAYYEQETNRLQILSRGTSLKYEELARMADEKGRQLAEAERKLGLRKTLPDKSPSPMKSLNDRAGATDKFEVESVFSAATHESELKTNQNILDVLIESGEFYDEQFTHVLDDRELALHRKTLITFVSAAFFNHDTQTSTTAEGYRPVYQTQFSFKNQVDDFYIQYLQKRSIKLDVFISKSNAAIHLGTAELFLRELWERESAVVETSGKSPTIEQQVRVNAMCANGASQISVGQLKVKLRMRKPITEAARYFRQKHEIEEMKRTSALDPRTGRLGSSRKIITVHVVGCIDLQSRHQSADMAPFFYYQFYNFDERYSQTMRGASAIFDDVQPYEVEHDLKLQEYLQTEALEIILFDDNAPVAGIAKGGVQNDQEDQNEDMIGTCRIPLDTLLKTDGIRDEFAVRSNRNETVGKLKVNVTISDLDGRAPKFGANQASMQYNQEWEKDLIYRIATRLARFGLPSLEHLFSIFSRGDSFVHKEDFKYCLLYRLRLKQEISEQEVERFLEYNQNLVNKETIDVHDFKDIFETAVQQAKMESQTLQVMQQETVHKYEAMRASRKGFGETGFGGTLAGDDDFSRQTSPLKDMTSHRTATNRQLTFDDREILDIVKQVALAGKVQACINKLNPLRTVGNQVQVSDLNTILRQEGLLTQEQAWKVSGKLEIQNGVADGQRAVDLLLQSADHARETSQPLKQFNTVIMNNGERLCRDILAQDGNRDGKLFLNGLKAAVLQPEYKIQPTDADHIFYLIQKEGFFYYKEYILGLNPTLAPFLSSVEDSLPTPHEESISQSQSLNAIPTTRDEQALRLSFNQIKAKISNYITQRGLTLSILFQVLDNDSDKSIDLQEFKNKMGALQLRLDEADLTLLFNALDKNKNGSITYQEFCREFSSLSNEILLKRIRSILQGAGTTAENQFNRYCTNKRENKMYYPDFKNFLQAMVPKATTFETQNLFQHFDQKNNEFISKAEFVQAFDRQTSERSFTIGIEDLIKPLATKVKQWDLKIPILFDKVDKNKNGLLSAQEIALIFKNEKFEIQADEILILSQYFQDNYSRREIRVGEFTKLLNTEFKREYNEPEAKDALREIKQNLAQRQMVPSTLFQKYGDETLVSYRNFKHAINDLHVLGYQAINNLTKFLDQDNSGFISKKIFDQAMANAGFVKNFGASQKSASLNRQRTGGAYSHSSKWTK